MTIEQMRTIHEANPFQPFTIHLADGRNIRVIHNQRMIMSPSGRTCIVYRPDDSFEIVDLLLVTTLEVHAGPSGNGQA